VTTRADGNDTSRCKGSAGGVLGNDTVYRSTVSWVFFSTLITFNEIIWGTVIL
jgi:hypothetical protein